MNKAITMFLLCVCISLHSVGQKVTVDKDGNYHAPVKPADKKTGKVYIDEDSVNHPIYISGKNKLYYIRKSKTSGKEYKVYLKID
jgi:ribosomal protein L31